MRKKEKNLIWANQKSEQSINSKDLQSYDNRLKEFLMTTFLVIVVYDLIAKPFWSYYYEQFFICKKDVMFNQSNISDTTLSIHYMINCSIENIMWQIPNWLFSTFPWANKNFLVTISSLVVTWVFIWMAYKFAKFVYKHEDIKDYMNWEWRKEFYTDKFWAILLLVFMMFSIVILFLYPIFWFIVFVLTLQAIQERKNN